MTQDASPANIQNMAHSFLIFDFGGNEEAAQQARHRIEGWKQGFRLDKKLQVKFDRKETDGNQAAPAPKAAKPAKKEKGKSGAKSKSKGESESAGDSESTAPAQVHLIVRLDFSDHEKLSHQRWLERIPSEEPFKTAHPRVVRPGEPDFKTTSDLFDSLD
ncbi:MAG TPA: hypothetical protein VKT71_02590 [Candidatus Acidoferrales bacterium]|nr:hypothetical protein [Candidatus Acidoferrales bacterium]